MYLFDIFINDANIPVVGNGEDRVGWLLASGTLDGIELDGMSVVFNDESLEIELSSMTSKVGQDGDNDCDD